MSPPSLGNSSPNYVPGDVPKQVIDFGTIRERYHNDDKGISPGEQAAMRAERDNRQHARKPAQYAELFDTPEDELFSGTVLLVGDPQIAVDMPGIITIDPWFLTKRSKFTEPISAVFPVTPFRDNSFDRVIDYNGVTRTFLAAPERERNLGYEPNDRMYKVEVGHIFLEAIRVLREGGTAHFGSLFWMRTPKNEHGRLFDLMGDVLDYYKQKGLIDYAIVDDPADPEENDEEMPKVSYLKITKTGNMDLGIDPATKTEKGDDYVPPGEVILEDIWNQDLPQ
jgi:hypothetical protein